MERSVWFIICCAEVFYRELRFVRGWLFTLRLSELLPPPLIIELLDLLPCPNKLALSEFKEVFAILIMVFD